MAESRLRKLWFWVVKKMTAKEAKEKTMYKINQVAREFLINKADPVIEEACLRGRFCCTVDFDKEISPEVTGPEVVRLLQQKGFKADHVYYDGPNGYENSIVINWEK